jgi:hypothetical protein
MKRAIILSGFFVLCTASQATDLAAAQTRTVLNPVIAEKIVSGSGVRITFPDGKKIIPTYAMGLPLGREKQVLEP